MTHSPGFVAVEVHHQNGSNSYVNDDVFFTRKDSLITFDVRLNDYKAFPIHTYSEPDKGTLTIDENDVFTYAPDLAYQGAVEFYYEVKPLNGLESGHVVIYVGRYAPGKCGQLSSDDKKEYASCVELRNSTGGLQYDSDHSG